MIDFLPDNLIAWITAVDIPLIAGFITAFAHFRTSINTHLDDLRERFNAYKLEVAQNYASINHVKDLESRVIAHLLRIETKLDNTTLKIYRGDMP